MSDAPEVKTVEQLKAHPYFVRLTPQQQVFVETLVTNGNNKIAAAHRAWTCKSDETARAFANKILGKADVAWLVRQFFGQSAVDEPFTREEMLALWAKKARTLNDEALVYKYCQSIAEVEGWFVKPSDNPVTGTKGGSKWDEIAAREKDLEIPKPE